MKEKIKVQKSKDYPLYLLHNELTSKNLTKWISAKYPETRRATYEQFIENQLIYVAK